MVYRPTARVLTVLELLQSHGRMTGAELARRLEVNIRTVRDYIEMLGDPGIPVEAERGRYGAYRLRPGYKLPPLIFTEDESLALTLSLLIARVQGFAQASAAFEGVLAKVMRVLPETTRIQVKAVEQTILFDDDSFRFPPSLLAVTVLSSALQAGQRVQLHYRSLQGEVTERGFDPYGVVSRDFSQMFNDYNLFILAHQLWLIFAQASSAIFTNRVTKLQFIHSSNIVQNSIDNL